MCDSAQVAFAAATTFATVVIAVAAITTWKATRSYARITGVAVLAEQLNYLLSGNSMGGAKTQAAWRIAKLVRLEFPDLYDALKNEFPNDARKEIEK